MPATTVGHYRIVERLAAGGMGVVYRAEDLTLDRPVALKFLTPEIAGDEEYRARFVREARVAAGLNHPNVCTVYEVGCVDPVHRASGDAGLVVAPGTPFIAMEFIEGETLAERIGREGRLRPIDAIDVALQIADGLWEAHSHQIIHRDLKPHNVMFAAGGRVKIVDFGLAKPLRPAIAGEGLVRTSEMLSTDLGGVTVIGTCAYMSPEQAAGRPLDSHSDIFSFGTLLYEMVSGRLPFNGETSTEILAKILEADPEPLANVTGGGTVLKRLIGRCLEKRPDDRYNDMREIASELRAARNRLTGGMRWRVKELLDQRPLATVSILFLVAVSLAYSAWRVLDRDFSLESARTGSVNTPAPPAESLDNADVTEPQPQRLDGGNTRGGPSAPSPNGGGNEPVSAARGPSSTTVTGPSKEHPVQPEKTGRLVISSSPRSSVSIDGNLAGVTPLDLDAAAGTHVITLASPDGLRWRGRITLAAGETQKIERDLNATGGLTVVADTWAEVSLDQGPPEQTPVHFPRVAAGLHELRAVRDGYVTQTWEIVIDEGKTTSFKVSLVKK